MLLNPLPVEFPPKPPTDSEGRIRRARSNLPQKSSLRLSPYCEHILALRLQGYTYPQISSFLAERGHPIAIATLCINLKAVGLNVPTRTREADAIGGRLGIDEETELEGQIFMMRRRIDKMEKFEEYMRKGDMSANPPLPPKPGYSHPRYERAVETMEALIKRLSDVRQRASERASEAAALAAKPKLERAITEEAMMVIRGLYLSGQITLPDDSDTVVAPKEIHEEKPKPELLN